MALTNTYTTGGTFPAADANAIATAVNAKNQVGTFSGRPAAGNLDAIYYCTDNDTVYHDTGSVWEKIRIASGSSDAMGDVPTSGWTAVNMQTGASWSADKDAMLFTVPTIGSSDNWQHQYRAYPTLPFTLTAYCDAAFKAYNSLSGAIAILGLVITDGTKLITFGPGYSETVSSGGWVTGTWSAALINWTNATTASSNVLVTPAGIIGALPKWYRIVDDNTNLTFKYSLNGIDWTTAASGSRTAFLTPSRIGVGGNNHVGNDALLRFRSWNGVA